MGRIYFYTLVVVFLIGIFDSSVDGYRYFRRGQKIEDSKASKFERWLIQNLDHFNPTDERVWQQRYYINDEFFNTTSRNVAFLFIGGESEATEYWMTNGYWYRIAKDFQPILFQLEHRYYGQSRPTEDISTENLVYLTSQQALADMAFFIEAMNVQYELASDVKWILFGGSYPGSLAAWMKQIYPYLVHAAVSTSGPLIAKLDFPEYYQVVQDALRADSDECANAVLEGTRQIETTLLDVAGQRTIDDQFKLCDSIQSSIDNPLEVSNFYSGLADHFAGVAQYNNDNREYTLQLNLTIEKLCAVMTDESFGKEINRLAAVNSLLLERTDQTCLDYNYDSMIDFYRNTSWDSGAAEGGRQWTYQTCTEFGFYQTSSYKPQIFGDHFDLDFFVGQCAAIFGPEFNRTFLDKAMERTNELYGGLDIEVSNVVFVHGSLDPWHVLGITQTRNSDAPAILIEGSAHCSDLYNPSDNDTPQLKAARVQIKNLITSWLDL